MRPTLVARTFVAVAVLGTLAVGLVVFWSREKNAEPTRWTSYFDEDAGFKMDCPNALRFEHTNYGTSCSGSYNAFIAQVVVIETSAATLAEWFEEYRQAADFVQPENIRETIFAGQPAYEVRADEQVDEFGRLGISYVRYHLVHAGKAYEINLSMTENDRARFEGGFRILETYTIPPQEE